MAPKVIRPPLPVPPPAPAPQSVNPPLNVVQWPWSTGQVETTSGLISVGGAEGEDIGGVTPAGEDTGGETPVGGSGEDTGGVTPAGEDTGRRSRTRTGGSETRSRSRTRTGGPRGTRGKPAKQRREAAFGITGWMFRNHQNQNGQVFNLDMPEFRGLLQKVFRHLAHTAGEELDGPALGPDSADKPQSVSSRAPPPPPPPPPPHPPTHGAQPGGARLRCFGPSPTGC